MHGSFVWYELATNDVDAAVAFYGKVVGWTARSAGPGMDYTILEAGDRGIGGVAKLTQMAKDNGACPGWIGYIYVDHVDAAAAKLVKLGGKIHFGPADIPTVGRFAVAGDPQGVPFTLFKPLPMENAPPPCPPGALGSVGWRELVTENQASAFDFYADMFGWTKDTAMDMGPMGVYQLFAIDGVQSGGMMNRPPVVPASFWAYYFNVDSIKAAIERLTAAGGKVMNGPMPVPDDMWVVQAIDPEGAFFCLLSTKE